jgi:hypothetical protein
VVVLAVLLAVVAAWGQNPVQINAPVPNPVVTFSGSAQGASGGTTLYYWIAARYPGGLSLPFGPVRVMNTVGAGNLTGANFVRVSWTPITGVTGYYVIRNTGPDFPGGGTCANCVVVANTPLTTFDDVGGGTTNWPPAGVAFAQSATLTVAVDNYSQASPFVAATLNGALRNMTLTEPFPTTGGSYAAPVGKLTIGTTGSYFGGLATGENAIGIYATVPNGGGYTQGVRSNLRTAAGGGGALRPFRAYGLAQNGSSLTELYGFDGEVQINAGGRVTDNIYGVVGYTRIDLAANPPTNYVQGVLGVLDSSVVLTGPIRGAVVGNLKYSSVAAQGADGAFVASRDASGTGVGGTESAGFRVRHLAADTIPGFNYGVDLYPGATAAANPYGVADVRGSRQDRLNNAAAGTWAVTRGTGNRTVFQLEATTFANLGAVVAGGLVNCADCAVTGAADNTCAGGGTGALAVGINGVWRCFYAQNVP